MSVLSDTIIDIDVVEYRYDTTTKALNGISLSISSGEFVVLLGRNGSGKSTLARLFNGLLLPTSGRVLVYGIDTRDQSGNWEVRRRVGMLFQEPDNQIVGATVAEDVAFGPENLGLAPEIIQVRVREALQAVNMLEYADHAPHLLSGSQKLKVSLAGVLAMQPSCVVLDESTSRLDPAGRKEIMSLLRRLNREAGLTVVLITHLMEEVCAADRAIVLHAGRIVRDGMPGDLFSDGSAIEELGLALPQVTELFHLLNRDGVNLPTGVLALDEAVELLNSMIGGAGQHVHQG